MLRKLGGIVEIRPGNRKKSNPHGLIAQISKGCGTQNV